MGSVLKSAHIEISRKKIVFEISPDFGIKNYTGTVTVVKVWMDKVCRR